MKTSTTSDFGRWKIITSVKQSSMSPSAQSLDQHPNWWGDVPQFLSTCLLHEKLQGISLRCKTPNKMIHPLSAEISSKTPLDFNENSIYPNILLVFCPSIFVKEVGNACNISGRGAFHLISCNIWTLLMHLTWKVVRKIILDYKMRFWTRVLTGGYFFRECSSLCVLKVQAH